MKLYFSKKNILTTAFTLFALAIFSFAPEVAHASAGQGLLTDVQNLLTGHLGTVVGLGISLFGLWVWLAQQSSWGLLIVIAGAAITAFPGLYKGMTQGFKSAFGTVGTGNSAM